VVWIGGPFVEYSGIEVFYGTCTRPSIPLHFHLANKANVPTCTSPLHTHVRTHLVLTGLGGTLYVGTGAGVFGFSPLVEAIALVNPHKDYWIQVRGFVCLS
jgi:hypothetical protein